METNKGGTANVHVKGRVRGARGSPLSTLEASVQLPSLEPPPVPKGPTVSSGELFGRKSCRLHLGWGRTCAECGKQAGTPTPSRWPPAAPTLPRPSATHPGRPRRLGIEIPASETGDAAGWAAAHTGPRPTAAAAVATARQSGAGAPSCSSEAGREHAPGPRH